MKKKINIITVNNGVGLEQDAKLLKFILDDIYDISIIDMDTYQPCDKADANIFLEKAREQYFDKADANLFIPNPEWLYQKEFMDYYDVVLCKTYDTLKIYNKMPDKKYDIEYIGFTSRDNYDPSVVRYKELFHNKGRSSKKGTEMIEDAYRVKGLLPCYIIDFQFNEEEIKRTNQNIQYITVKIKDKLFKYLQNRFMVHLCPSIYEGYGHYINEAKGVAALVITTDAPPMNELVLSEYGILIPYVKTDESNFAVQKYVSPEGIINAIDKVAGMSEEEILRMGKLARESFIRNDVDFKQRIKSTLKRIISNGYSINAKL